MLKITMLKLKRAWSLALTLRSRGDTRFPGKFLRLMTVRTTQKSTVTDKENEQQCKQIIEYLFSPLRTPEEIRRIQSIILGDIRRLQRAVNKQENNEQNLQNSTSNISLEAEKCDKFMSDIFGDLKSHGLGSVSCSGTPEKTDATLIATTAKQTAEQLAQKIEVIEETSLVEAEKPKIEGFNTPPRVLGYELQHAPCIKNIGESGEMRTNVMNKFDHMVRRLENNEILSRVTPLTCGVVNFSSNCSNQGGKSGGSSGEDKQDEYDSIAKRHLNTPNNELNDRLVNEMKQLGVPQGSPYTSMNIEMDASKKPRKPSEKFELEARKCEHDSPTASNENQNSVSDQTVHNRSLQATPRPTFLSKLHEEGIRYSEQITSSSEDKKDTKHHGLQRELCEDPKDNSMLLRQNQGVTENNVPSESNPNVPFESHPIVPSESNPISLSQSKNVEEKNDPCASDGRIPPHLYPWTMHDPHFKHQCSGPRYLPRRPNAYEKNASIDSEEPILDPYDKKNIASDSDTYGYKPLGHHTINYGLNQSQYQENMNTAEPVKSTTDQPVLVPQNVLPNPKNYPLIHDTANITEQTKNAENTHTAKFDISTYLPYHNQNVDKSYNEVHHNRDVPCNTQMNPLFRQLPDETSSESGAATNATEEKTIVNTETLKPEETVNQPFLANQTPVLNTEATYQGMWLNRDMPYYSNQIANNATTDQSATQHIQLDQDPLRYQTSNVTEQNEMDQNLQATEPEKTTSHPIATNQASGTTYTIESENTTSQPQADNRTQRSNLETIPNRGMPYSENPVQSNAYFNQLRDQNNQLSHELINEQGKVSGQTIGSEGANLEPRNVTDQSATPNQIPASYLNITHQGMYMNRDSPYYYDYYQNYIYLNKNYWLTAEELAQEMHRQKCLSDNRIFSACQDNTYPELNPNRIFGNYYTDVSATDVKSNLDSSNPTSNFNAGPVEQSQFPLNAAHNQERPSNEIDCQNPENAQFLHQQTWNPQRQLNHADNEHSSSGTNQPNIVQAQDPGDTPLSKQDTNTLCSNTGQADQAGQPENAQQYTNLPQYYNFWNPFWHSEEEEPQNIPPKEQESKDSNQSDSTNPLGKPERRPPYDAHKPLPDPKSLYQGHLQTTDNRNDEIAVQPLPNQLTETEPTTVGIPFQQNVQSHQQLAKFFRHNPYSCDQSYTYFGKYPNQQDPWKNHLNSEEKNTEIDQEDPSLIIDQTPKDSVQDTVSLNQETIIRASEMTHDSIQPQDSKSKALMGPSAAFVSMPQKKWKPKLTPPEEEEPPHEKVQIDSSGISTQPEIDIPLPQDKNVPLSELLRRVRQRSRQEFLAGQTEMEPLEGKCGRKRPRCPPPPPQCPQPPPVPPPPCPGPPPPCPRPCKPKCPSPCVPPTPQCPPPPPPCPPKKSPCCKFASLSLNTLYPIFTLIWDFVSSKLVYRRPIANCSSTQTAGCLTKTIISEEMLEQLHLLGHNFLRTYGSELGSYCWKLETLALVRGFDPWVPMPSSPLPIKTKKKPYVCPKEGCKERPPPRYGAPCERPCYPGNPCLGFPNKYRKH